MSTLRLRYVQAFNVGGQRFHYFRRKGMARVPLPGIPGSTEFMAAYSAALDSMPLPVGANRIKPGSVAFAVTQYLASTTFRTSLGPSTAQSRRLILEKFSEKHGHLQIASLPKQFLTVLIGTMEPHVGRSMLKAARGLMKWCVEQEYVREDVTQGIRVKLPKTDGYYTWTEDDIAAFEARHPIGSQARLALALALYTAQRRGDIIRMGPQHIRLLPDENGELKEFLHVKQQKTGTELDSPVLPELRAIIDATPCGHFTFLDNGGKPYSAEYFSQVFRRWCDQAGLPDQCTVHGLRKAACTQMANARCTVHEIASRSGHKSLAEVERYTRKADQRRLAMEAAARITNESVKTNSSEVSKPLTPLEKIAS